MSFLLVAGILGVILGIFLIFFPMILNVLSKMSDQTVIDIDESSFLTRFVTGLAQIVIGIWLIFTSQAYAELWYLLYIGILAIIFGVLFAFFPKVLKAINDWGNLLLFSDSEIAVWQRMIYGLIILAMGSYILYVYITSPK